MKLPGPNLEVYTQWLNPGIKQMLGTRCEGHTSTDRRAGSICPRCGGVIPSDDVVGIMLETLAQLARFGLDAEARPLLSARDEDR